MLLPAVLAACSSTGPTGPGPDADPPPAPWTAAVPVLEVQELAQGRASVLRVSGAPDGAQVTVWRGTREGTGPCRDTGRCLGLVDPEPVAEGEVGAGEQWLGELVTPDDAPTGAFLFQAEVVDPVEGWVATDPVLRNVSIPPERAAVGFTLAGQLGPATTGNTHTGGAAWVDYDGDFWPDLVVTNGAGAHRALYRNEGDGTFTHQSDAIRKPDASIEDAGVLFGDLDDDGDSDLIFPVDSGKVMTFYVPQPYDGGPNQVYLNQGDGTFVEAGEAFGVVDPRGWRTSAAALADVDRDGYLDLWLGNWAMSRLPPGDNLDRLLMNRGGTGFEEVPGFDRAGRDALVGLFFDLDRDLWPDLYVGNVSGSWDPPDYDPVDQLYRNRDGELVEDPEAVEPGWGDDAWGAMGADVGDVDNDGDWDLYVTNVWLPTPPPRGNPLYLGDGSGGLTDNRCDVAGVCAGHKSWPTAFADFDRDGWVDLFVGTSTVEAPDLVFVNDGDGTFTSHRVPAMQENFVRGGAAADYDGDGDVDLYLWRLFQKGALYANDGRDEHHWIELKLLGTESNTDAIGAELELRAPGLPAQLRRVSGADSAHSQQDLVVHFGLGAAATADVTVRWPSGRVDELSGLAGDRFHLVVEGEGAVPEEIEATAVHDPDAGTVEVRATSTLRGRSRLAVAGLGPVRWRAGEKQYREVFPVPDRPATIEVVTGAGARVVVPVESFVPAGAAGP